MRTMIYLRRGQVTGKSTLPVFLAEAVLGVSVVHSTSDPQTVLGTFNGEMLSKVLLVLEEMPTASKGHFMNLADRLKNLVTGKQLAIHRKYHEPTQVQNSVNVMVISNHGALRMEADDRRTVCLDVSNARVGDFAYFRRLHAAAYAPGVDEAFYRAMLDLAAEPFYDYRLPRTEAMVENLHPFYSWLKTHHIRRGKGVNEVAPEPTAAPVPEDYDFADLLAEILNDEPSAPEPAAVDDEPANVDLMAEILADLDG